MRKDKYIFIITAAMIALLLLHKGSDGFPDNSPAKESSVDVTTSDEVLTVDEDMPEGAEGVMNAPEEAGPALPLTPMPELIELDQEEPYKPAPDVPVAKEGPNAEETGSARLEGDKRLTTTRGMVLVQDGCFVMGNLMEDSFWGIITFWGVCFGV